MIFEEEKKIRKKKKKKKKKRNSLYVCKYGRLGLAQKVFKIRPGKDKVRDDTVMRLNIYF